jgi:SNF family Na+-dependent transporter
MNHEHRHEPDSGKETKSRTKWVFIGFLGIAAFLLIVEHRTHVFGWLSSYGIWLLLLACPLMHMFMHGGHGHGKHGDH